MPVKEKFKFEIFQITMLLELQIEIVYFTFSLIKVNYYRKNHHFIV